jgi:molecular chaperone DnaK (HSP70)
MKEKDLAIDLGTTNTVVARWNDSIDGPEILHLPDISRKPEPGSDIDDSFTIPSACYLIHPKEWYTFPLRWLFGRSRKRTGAFIGNEAVVKDGGQFTGRFVKSFKSALGRNSFQTIGTLERWKYTAEEITRIFLRELFDKVKEDQGARPSEVTFCVPVDFYESYRAKLHRIARSLGIKKVKTVDEPVAAALGYGLGCDDDRKVLVIDFGAGTIDLALITTARLSENEGRARVVAKNGAPVGGNLVDAWIVEDLCKRYNYNFDRLSSDRSILWWYRILTDGARKLKENLFVQKSDTFFLMPSGVMAPYSLPGDRDELRKPTDYTRDDLVTVLKENGLYGKIDELLDGILHQASQRGISIKTIDDVIMIGGSTLLPGVYKMVEKRFGRERVRAWQPFNAVAFGAAAFGAEKVRTQDHVSHDYAIVTYDKVSHEKVYNVIIPAGTEFPTKKDFWKKQLVPTCALGEPERMFKLVICEIGRNHGFDQEFIWDDKGDLHIVKGDDASKIIVPLNEDDPVLGYLRPPHFPSEKGARIDLSFMINEERWLCATVYDIKTGRYLMEEKPVIRLK